MANDSNYIKPDQIVVIDLPDIADVKPFNPSDYIPRQTSNGSTYSNMASVSPPGTPAPKPQPVSVPANPVGTPTPTAGADAKR